MNINDIYSQIIKHQTEGIMFHYQAHKMMKFLGFYGFAKQQKRKYLKETMSMIEINNYIIEHHGVMLSEGDQSDVGVIPTSWYGYQRKDIDNNTRISAIKDIFDKCINWEQSTKELYCEMYKQACDNNHIADAVEIKKLICDVSEELANINNQYIEYKSVDFNISYIMDIQEEFCKKYVTKII